MLRLYSAPSIRPFQPLATRGIKFAQMPAPIIVGLDGPVLRVPFIILPACSSRQRLRNPAPPVRRVLGRTGSAFGNAGNLLLGAGNGPPTSAVPSPESRSALRNYSR